MKFNFLFFILLFSFQVKALMYNPRGLSVRALGMGGAYTALVNDDDSLYYNPAGYGKMSGFQWVILDPNLGLNGLNAYSEYSDLFANSSTDMASVLNALYGKNIWAHTGMKTLISIGGLSFGAYGNADINLNLENPAYPNLYANYYLDYAYVAGFGFEFVPQVFSMGAQLRYINRSGGQIPIGPSSLALLNSNTIEEAINQSQGTAYGLDLGMQFEIPVNGKPTIGVMWRDIGDTTFKTIGGHIKPDTDSSDLTLGMGMIIDGPGVDIKPAFDIRYLNQGGQIGKKINFGVEVDLPILDIRAGFHQGYYTLGTSFDAGIMRIDAATYGVELGEYPGQLEDRRYILQLSIGFGLDPSLGSFTWGDPAKNRGLKKRR